MSWSSSAYDENPFSDNNENNNNNIGDRVPLASKVKIQETPSWLQDEPESLESQKHNPNNNNNNGEATTTATDPAVPRFILYTRVINLALSVCMLIVSLLSLLTTQTATTGVLSCYVVVFACLLCCFETHLKQVSKKIALNFGFMYSARSRSLFMMFIGTILFSFSLFGKIIGLLMLLNAFFNIYILCRYPEFEDAQRNDAQSEIKDFLSTNPAFAKNIMDASMKVGTDIIKNNPDMARKGAEAILSSSVSVKKSPSVNNNEGYSSV